MTDYTCAECGDPNMSVMVKDELWKLISENNNRLCLSCMEHFLDREITLSDLKECGFTRTIRIFVMRERRRKHD